MTKQISALRRHMIEDMKMRNSQKLYTYAVANFAAFHGPSPDKLGAEHVREYRLHLIERGLKDDLDQSNHRRLLLLWHDAAA